MTGPEAIAILKQLGISQARFARMTGQHVNTITKWAKGESPPSGPAVALLKLLELRPELVAVLEEIAAE